MNINEYFEKIYCVNLEKRPDRWVKCDEIFKKHNIQVERFGAIDGYSIENTTTLLPGEFGLIKTHIEILKIAKENNYKNILIFEDDVELCDDFSDKFNEYYNQIPKEWDFLYFGGNHLGSINQISQNIFRLSYTFTTHAFAINNNLYDELMLLLKSASKQVDVIYAELHSKYNSYTIKPTMAWQRSDYSDIQGGIMNYDFLKDI